MDNLVLAATTEDINRYAGKTCVEAEEDFRKEFDLSNEKRPFVNFFLCGRKEGNRVVSIHWNYGFLTPEDYRIKRGQLYGLVDAYLNKTIPRTTIRFLRPPLIITDKASKTEVLQTFDEFGFSEFVDVPRK